jgi:gamma-glutamyl hydrolase
MTISELICLACLSICASTTVKQTVVNEWPIIGIFTQPSTSKSGTCGGDCLYIAASYVKVFKFSFCVEASCFLLQYVEAAGARVVPISYYATPAELDELLSSVNGVLFPGGGSSYPSSAQYAFDKIVELNKNGNVVLCSSSLFNHECVIVSGNRLPLWGTCMGFQWVSE